MSALLKEPNSAILATDSDLEELALRLQGRLFGRVKNFRLARQGDGVVLHGQTSSYYAKQLAQHAVMSSSDLPIYGNEIMVD